MFLNSIYCEFKLLLWKWGVDIGCLIKNILTINSTRIELFMLIRNKQVRYPSTRTFEIMNFNQAVLCTLFCTILYNQNQILYNPPNLPEIQFHFTSAAVTLHQHPDQLFFTNFNFKPYSIMYFIFYNFGCTELYKIKYIILLDYNSWFQKCGCWGNAPEIINDNIFT
jgi:hypothetical protein